MTPRILITAGEPSGDLHAARIVAALRARMPEAVIELGCGFLDPVRQGGVVCAP